MFVKFDAKGLPAEGMSVEPTNPEGFYEIADATFENLYQYRLQAGKVVQLPLEQADKERAIQQVQGDLLMNLQTLRGKIDLAQSVAELTKKVDLTIQLLHALVTANDLKAALSAADQVRYDETVAEFAGPVNIMNVYDYKQSLADIKAANDSLIKEIQAYYVRKLAILEEHGLTPADVNF
ncbi:MAG TPA: hypothetical protein VK464_19765 [Symbiobacteriaceae bacterium]|jgi:hypothetical protein|nr:hypothetical protein [Symbiobacteriaceae bacterium]